MSNEDLNKSIWSNKLDELESLPGEAIPDKNALWEKLHEKLKGKKNVKRFAWYWIAAASVLVLLMISLLNLNREIKKENLPIAKSQPAEEPVNTVITSPIIKKDLAEVISPVLLKKNNTTAFANKKNKSQFKRLADTKNIFQVVDTVSEHGEIAQSSNIVAPSIKNTFPATIFPSKKKLRVVHVNELGDPIEESPDVARNADIHYFQFKFGNGAAYINSSVTSKTTDYSFLKTKTSPN